MNEEILEFFYSFEDIESVEENEYVNVYDLYIDSNEHLFLLDNGIVSHNSASVSIQPVLGRKENAYFELKGVPLNSWEVTPQKLSSNVELSNLYKVLKNFEPQFEKDGKWLEIEINNETIIVNENDEILINGEYVEVKKLLKTNTEVF